MNAVAPGLIGTDITGGALEGERKAPARRGHAGGARRHCRRRGRPDHYLCRPESDYITGVTYDVNGGSHIH